MKKLSNTEAELKKCVAFKKSVYCMNCGQRIVWLNIFSHYFFLIDFA